MGKYGQFYGQKSGEKTDSDIAYCRIFICQPVKRKLTSLPNWRRRGDKTWTMKVVIWVSQRALKKRS